MGTRGELATLWPVGVVLVAVLSAGLLVVGRAADSTAGRQPGSPEAVASGDQAPRTDPADSSLSAEPTDDSTTEAEPSAPSTVDREAESPTPSPDRPDVVIPYRVRVGTDDARTADFPAVVHDVLTDPRGWVRAGFRFVRDPDAAYTIVIAEGEEVDRLCHPYDTAGAYSCQNGPVVALNADRWRAATREWPGTLTGYRTMLVNHEVGHLLHLHHPEPQCPGPGLPSPVMAQQSGGPAPCLPHPWPLQWEIDQAAQRREPLAPPSGHDVSDHRPTPPAARS